MQLSIRLQMAVDFISDGSKVADVGCDHAYTSIYLAKNRSVQHIIAMDVNQGPLERAEENVKKYQCEDAIECRLSNGLQALHTGEADSVLLAGMGGGLMIQILSESSELVKTMKELILQPQSEIHLVRKYLHMMGWQIVGENMCYEDGKYYTCIRAASGRSEDACGKTEDICEKAEDADGKAKDICEKAEDADGKANDICEKAEDAHRKAEDADGKANDICGKANDICGRSEADSELFLYYGELLLKNHHPILLRFLEKEIQNKQMLLERLVQKNTERLEKRVCELREECTRLDNALQFVTTS